MNVSDENYFQQTTIYLFIHRTSIRLLIHKIKQKQKIAFWIIHNVQWDWKLHSFTNTQLKLKHKFCTWYQSLETAVYYIQTAFFCFIYWIEIVFVFSSLELWFDWNHHLTSHWNWCYLFEILFRVKLFTSCSSIYLFNRKSRVDCIMEIVCFFYLENL